MQIIVCRKCGGELPGPPLVRQDSNNPIDPDSLVPEYQKLGFCSEECQNNYKEALGSPIILPMGEKLVFFSISPRGDLVFLTKGRQCREKIESYNIFIAEMIKDTDVLAFSLDVEKIIVIQES